MTDHLDLGGSLKIIRYFYSKVCRIISTQDKEERSFNEIRECPDLIHSDEEAVNIVSWGAWVQCVFVLLDLHLDKLSQLLNTGEHIMVWAWQMLHDPREDVIHLREESTQYTAALFLRDINVENVFLI